MLLKYLDLQGFKSFPDKTRVTFGSGLTAVVGPNGSGKSNISDAVRWVLGEQSTKTLRGEKMEDVIFTGTKTRKSQGFAEVSLTVDNFDRQLQIDIDEVTITRRYDRSGESEYMINRSPVRLKDIQELFMDTGLGKDGYSLIGQGKISEIIQSKSGERREIFDEAAGISKFRYHKTESERSLARAEGNLVRLRDILAELEGRVEPLKEQSKKAKCFLELSQAKKKLEVSLWVDTIDKSNKLLKDQSDKILIMQEKHNTSEQKISEIEENIQNTFSEMQKRLVFTETTRHQKSNLENEISEIIAQIAVLENDISHHEQDISRISTEIEGYVQNSDFTVQEIAKKTQEISEIEIKLSSLRDIIELKQKELTEKFIQSEGMSKQEKEFSDEINSFILKESKAKMVIAASEMNASELAETLLKNEEMKVQKETELVQFKKELSEVKEFTENLCKKS